MSALDPQPDTRLEAPDIDRGARLDSAPMSSGRRWACILANYGLTNYAGAERELSADGWRTYFPLHLDRHNGRIGSLFASYAFVALDPETDDWPRIYRTRHVFTLLCREGRPLLLPCGYIEDLQARTSSRRIVDDPGEHPEASRIRAGATGTVLQGPWAGWSGLCTLSRRDRLTLLLGLFSRQVSVELRHDQVIAA